MAYYSVFTSPLKPPRHPGNSTCMRSSKVKSMNRTWRVFGGGGGGEGKGGGGGSLIILVQLL